MTLTIFFSAARLQLHDGEAGRDRGGHGRRPLLALKEGLPGTDGRTADMHSD